MEEEKRKKIVAAITVNAILLLFIIVGVLIYQIIEIGVLTSRKKALNEELAAVRRKYEYAQDILDRLETDDEYLRIITELGKLGEDVSEYRFETV